MLLITKDEYGNLPGSFGSISSIALEGKTLADRMQVSGLDCMILSSLSSPNRNIPGKTV